MAVELTYQPIILSSLSSFCFFSPSSFSLPLRAPCSWLPVAQRDRPSPAPPRRRSTLLLLYLAIAWRVGGPRALPNGPRLRLPTRRLPAVVGVRGEAGLARGQGSPRGVGVRDNMARPLQGQSGTVQQGQRPADATFSRRRCGEGRGKRLGRSRRMRQSSPHAEFMRRKAGRRRSTCGAEHRAVNNGGCRGVENHSRVA